MSRKRISVISIAICIVTYLSGCSSPRPENLGVVEGRLAPCPETPNCVSSRAPDKGHLVAPLTFTGTSHEAVAKLKTIIRPLPRTAIISETDAYLHIEVRSAIFRFVDDVEFLVDDTERKIHVRSASRVGYSDLGVNRGRI